MRFVMITMEYQGGMTIALQIEGRTLIVFAKSNRKPKENELLFYDSPEEEPKEHTISWPGEYDIDGLAIRGVGHEEGAAVSYAIEVEGVRFAFLHSPMKEWSDYELELLGNVDVLCVPSNNPKILQKIIDDIDPRVLVPLNTGDADKYAETLKACGAQGKELVDTYDIRKSALPSEGRDVVVLRARS